LAGDEEALVGIEGDLVVAVGRAFTIDRTGETQIVVTGLPWRGQVCQQVEQLCRADRGPRRGVAHASVAKLIATDAAMKVTTDAVQVFGGVGYTRDYRVERYMREAKVMQIFEGTNQIQRLVIARSLTAK
jgi:alkylation response protein AidB-like acyl-CoA dehydrogenase